MKLIHNKTASQYEYHERPLNEVSPKAFVRYDKDNRFLYITKVKVPTRFLGKDIGEKMVSEVIAKAGIKGLRVKPKCEFAQKYMDAKGFAY